MVGRRNLLAGIVTRARGASHTCARTRGWQTVAVPAEALSLLLPEGLSAASVADTLAGEVPIVTQKAHTIERTFWDTFDGRLHGAGLALVDAGRRLALVDATTGSELAGGSAQPRRPAAARRRSPGGRPAPRARAADRDARADADRRACAAACCPSTCSTRSARSSCACASRSRRPTPVAGSDGGAPLRARLHVIGVLGYDRELAQLREVLSSVLGLDETAPPVQDEAVARVRRARRRVVVEAAGQARPRRPRRRRRRDDPAAARRGHRAQPAGHARGRRHGVPARPARRRAQDAGAAARAGRGVRSGTAARVSRRVQGAAADHRPDARPRRAAAGVRRARRGAARRRRRRRRAAAPAARGPPDRRAPRDGRALRSERTRAVLDDWSRHLDALVDSDARRAPRRRAADRATSPGGGSCRSTGGW